MLWEEEGTLTEMALISDFGTRQGSGEKFQVRDLHPWSIKQRGLIMFSTLFDDQLIWTSNVASWKKSIFT